MKHLLARVLLHVALLAITAITLTPMVWLVTAAFKHPDYVFSYTFLGPLVDEPDPEQVFAWHFWNTFEREKARAPQEAFRIATRRAADEAWSHEPAEAELTAFLHTHPGIFGNGFPATFDREQIEQFRAYFSGVFPEPLSMDFPRHFQKNFQQRFDPRYTGAPIERPRRFLPTLSRYNFRNLFDSIPFGRYVINSFFVTCAAVLIQVFFSSLGGFALAKYDFKGRKLVMVLMLLTMMIPGQVLLAPLYELIYHMRLVDTYIGLIIPGAVSVFGMFLFRQSMLHIPNDLLEAGRVDGCSEFGIYWNIVLPVSRPMIGAFTLIAFMGGWNSFIWPQIILHTQERFTLTIGLSQMVSVYEGNYGALMAGTFLSVLPVVVLFFMLQKEFISGLTAGAVKA